MKSISKRKRNMHVSLFFLILIVCAEINNVHAILQQHRQKLSDKTSGIVMTSSKEEEKTMDEADPKGGFLASYIKKINCDKRRVRELFFAAHKKHIKLSKVEVLAQFRACVKENAKKKAINVGLKKEDKEQNKDPSNEPEDDSLILEFRSRFNVWNRNKFVEKPNVFSHITSNAPSYEAQSVGRCKNVIRSAKTCLVAMKENMLTDKTIKGWGGDALTLKQKKETPYGCWFNRGDGKYYFNDNKEANYNKCKFLQPCICDGGKRDYSKADNGKMVFDGDKNGKSLNAGGARTLTLKPFNMKFGGAIRFAIKMGNENGTKWCQRSVRRLQVEEQAKKKEEALKAKLREEKEKRDLKRMMELKRQTSCESGRTCNGHGTGNYSATCDKEWNCGNRSCICKCIPGYLGKRCEKSYQASQCQSVGDPHPLSLDGLRFNLYDAGEFVMFKHPEIPTEVRMLTRMAHPHIAATAGVAMKFKNTIFTFEQPHCANGNTPQFRVEKDGKCLSGVQYGKKFALDGLTYDGGKRIRGPFAEIFIGGWWRYHWYRGQCGSAYWLNAYFNIRAPRDGKATGLCGAYGKGANYDNHLLTHSGGRRPHHQISRGARDKFKVDAKESFFTCGFWNKGFRYSPYRFKSLKQGQNMKQLQSAAAMANAETQLAKEFAEDDKANKENDEEDEKPAKAGKNETKTMSKEKALAKCQAKPDIATEEALSNCVNDMMLTADPDVEKVAAKESEEEEEEASENIVEDEKEQELELAAEAKLKVPGPLDPVLQWCVGNCTGDSNWKQLKAYPEKVYGRFLEDGYRTMTARIPDAAKVNGLQLRFYQKDHGCHCCNEFYLDDVTIYGGGMGVSIVADKGFDLFADNKYIGSGDWWEPAKDTYRFRVRKATKVFAVKVKGGNDARMGLLGSFGKHLVTSSSWKCTVNYYKNWKHPEFDDGEWPAAVEEGPNGILPWGERPGIAKKARWIFTHDTYKMRGQTAYCRVKVNDVKLSASEHPSSTRWSCKSNEHLQAPAALQLNGDMMTAVEVRGGKEKDDHFSPGESFTTKVDGADESRVLLKLKTKSFLASTEEGAMLKRAVLRIKVLEASEDEIIACRLIREWSAAEVTWITQPAYEGPKERCIFIKPNKKNDWVDIDISDWMRQWMSEPKSNYGMVLIPQGKDAATLVSHLDPQSEERPRLSLSCHGDKSDANLVFKAVQENLISRPNMNKSTGNKVLKKAVKAILKGQLPLGGAKKIREEVARENEIMETKSKLEKLEKEKSLAEKEAKDAADIEKMRKAELKGMNAEDLEKGDEGAATAGTGMTGATGANKNGALSKATGAEGKKMMSGKTGATGAASAKVDSASTGAATAGAATAGAATAGAATAGAAKTKKHQATKSSDCYKVDQHNKKLMRSINLEPCTVDPTHNHGEESYEKMEVVPTIVKTKVTNSKPTNSLTGASGARSSKKIAVSPTGGATAGAFTGSATGSNSQKKAGMNIDSSDYDNEPNNKVSKIMKVKKSSNGTKQMMNSTTSTNTTLF
jgi:hypothetical protein